MKRSRAITLVLLGGGVVLGLGGCGDSRREDCERARREMRPDAEEICARVTSSTRSRPYYGGGSWFFGRSAGAAAQGTGLSDAGRAATSSRGGFGGTGSRFASGA
ncbi:hypothetical protein [Caldovatus sediminis]|uniref:hypothetical protein n=1 Tax=Caldovatus sediminis TaxID=2041189 RepID=UPI001669D201|nr:hypothetical protein [Caldovatus sediminis]